MRLLSWLQEVKLALGTTASLGRSRCGTAWTERLNQHLERRRMAEKGLRTRCEAVGSGEEDGDQVADVGPGQHDVVGEPVERRAETADHAGLLLRRSVEAGGDRDREVAAHDLSEIARRRELVVHSAVGDEEGLAVTHLPVDYPGQIDP